MTRFWSRNLGLAQWCLLPCKYVYVFHCVRLFATPWMQPISSSVHGIFQARILMCAKSLQSCLTLCYPVDYSPSGSSVHGILQARILGWVAISFSISRVGFHFLLQGIFPTGGLNPSLLCLLHWQADSLSLYHLGSPSATVGYHVRSQWREIYLEVEWLCQTQKPPAILKAVFVDEL